MERCSRRSPSGRCANWIGPRGMSPACDPAAFPVESAEGAGRAYCRRRRCLVPSCRRGTVAGMTPGCRVESRWPRMLAGHRSRCGTDRHRRHGRSSREEPRPGLGPPRPRPIGASYQRRSTRYILLLQAGRRQPPISPAPGEVSGTVSLRYAPFTLLEERRPDSALRSSAGSSRPCEENRDRRQVTRFMNRPRLRSDGG